MPVFQGKLISQNVCKIYEGNEAALYKDLGDEKPEAIRCLTYQLLPRTEADGYKMGLSKEEIDNIVMDTVIKTIIQIQRGRQ